MKKVNKATALLLKAICATVLSFLLSTATYSQCNNTAWQASAVSSSACPTQWVNAGQFVNANGALQMTAAQSLCPVTTTNFFPQFQMTSDLAVPNNFSYELRLRNQNPQAGHPNPDSWSAYEVYIKLRSAGNQESGVTIIDSNPLYSWADPFTRLFAGPMGAPSAETGANFACLRRDLNNWITVRLTYLNHVLTCSINGVACATVNYTGDICTINSLAVTFKAAGELDWVQVLDANNNQIWREDFNSAPVICFTPFPAPTNADMAPYFIGPTCDTNKLRLFANPNQVLSGYSWTGPNGFTSIQQNPEINNPSAAYNGTYTVTGQLNSCSPVITRNVVVNFNVPGITSNIPDVTICNGDSVQLTASGGTGYSWTPNFNISNTTIANPIVWPNVTTNYIVTITRGSCTKVDTVTVTVNNCTKCTDSCYWNILGNKFITQANFLGTINSADLRIRTNNRERMIITSAGNVGINLAASQVPNAKFHVNNNGTINTRLENLPISKQAANLYVDAQGFVYAGRRSIFGRETDDADKDIEVRIASLEKHINNVSSNTSTLAFRSESGLTVINDMQSLVTTLSNQVNDLQSQIDALSQRLDNCGCFAYKSAPGKGNDKAIDKPAVEKARIVSVNPNPFAKTTSVHYSVPASTQQAELRLMNISGAIIKTIAINNKQPDGNIALSESFMAKGSYLLVLIADGKVADSKIIVTTGD
jgi:hypothetical protein